MKKEVKSTSKRKWIVGGVVAFSCVALLTTGFAVWIIGVNQKTDDSDVSVGVDTVQNESIKFSMTLNDNAIKLAEGTKVETGLVTCLEPEIDPLKITFSEIKLEVGAKFLEQNNITSISYAFKAEAPTYANEAVKVASTGNKIGTLRTNKEEGWTYLNVPLQKDITWATDFEKDNEASTTSLEVWKVKSDSLNGFAAEFLWGDFFGNSSPCTYYNALETADQNALMDGISQELSAMYDVLNGKTLSLEATINTSEKV